MPLATLTFIACGAFSGLQTVAQASEEARSGGGIGFDRQPPRKRREAIATEFDQGLLGQTETFQQFGFLPELIGRFNRFVAFEPLDRTTLKEILVDNVLQAYEREFADEGLELAVEDAVLDHIVEGAVRRETGARGLAASLLPALEEAAYQGFGRKPGAKVRLGLEEQGIGVAVRRPRKPRSRPSRRR